MTARNPPRRRSTVAEYRWSRHETLGVTSLFQIAALLGVLVEAVDYCTPQPPQRQGRARDGDVRGSVEISCERHHRS